MIGLIIGLSICAIIIGFFCYGIWLVFDTLDKSPVYNGVVVETRLGVQNTGFGGASDTACVVKSDKPIVYDGQNRTKFLADNFGGLPCQYQVGDKVKFKIWESFKVILQ